MSCEHPLAFLTVDAGGTGQRGKAPTLRVLCESCKAVLPEALGLKLLVESMRTESRLVWEALERAGAPRQAPADPPEISRSARGTCPHYLSWQRVQSSGAGRGSSGVIHFWCAGCKQAWNQVTGLKVFLDRVKTDYDAIWKAMRKHGIGT